MKVNLPNSKPVYTNWRSEWGVCFLRYILSFSRNQQEWACISAWVFYLYKYHGHCLINLCCNGIFNRHQSMEIRVFLHIYEPQYMGSKNCLLLAKVYYKQVISHNFLVMEKFHAGSQLPMEEEDHKLLGCGSMFLLYASKLLQRTCVYNNHCALPCVCSHFCSQLLVTVMFPPVSVRCFYLF